jgi:hypothetical protein
MNVATTDDALEALVALLEALLEAALDEFALEDDEALVESPPPPPLQALNTKSRAVAQ